MKKIISKVFAVALVVMTAVAALQVPASAASAYSSYVYDNAQGFYYSAPEAAGFTRVVDVKDIVGADGKNLQRLQEPSDIHASYDNKLYITDPKTNRIVVLTDDYKFVTEITTFKNTIVNSDGTTVTIDDTFTEPQSVFVDKSDGSIYICDSKGVNQNNVPDDYAAKLDPSIASGRIVQLDKNYNLVRVIYNVESQVLPETFSFQPTKVAVDSIGRIFVVSYGFNQGLVELDVNGEFVQCLGAPDATFTLFEEIQRMFATEEELANMRDFTATEYNNLDITEDDFIYATIDAYETAEEALETKFVQKLNAKGNDVLLTQQELPPYGDYLDLKDGEYAGPSKICDVASLDCGMYAILDRNRCRVFVYNNEGQHLFEFGAPADYSDKYIKSYVDGTLQRPVAMDWIGNTCYVLDGDKNTVNVFDLTEYGEKIFEATKLHYLNDYDAEGVLWEEILKLNNNSAAAKNSLGMVAYRQEDWNTAMSYFKQTYNTESYSKAYKYWRKDAIEENFLMGLGVIILAVVVIIVAKKLWKKFVPVAEEKSYRGQVGYATTLMTHPLHGYWELAREGRGGLAAANTILILAMIASLVQARFTGFAFDPTAETTNIVMEFAKLIGLVLLYSVCSWCVTALMSGEAGFKTIYISTCYALTPMIIFYPISIVLSNIMALDEGNLYSLFVILGMAWTLGLVFFGTMRIHDYSLGKAVGVTVITICVMILVVFLAVLFIALVQQMIEFGTTISNELATR